MNIQTDRFGTIDIDDDQLITLNGGLLGLPNETSFVLFRHGEESPIGWLQSAKTPELALPVVTVDALDYDYPEPSALELRRAGLQPGALAVMAVISANRVAPATVNLVAPIIVNTETREGAQILRMNAGWSVRQPFALRAPTVPTTANAPAVEHRLQAEL